MHTVFDYAGLDVDKHVRIDERFFRPHEVPVLLGDPSKAKKILDWEPKVDFHNLAQMMYEADLKELFQRGM